MRSDSAAKIRNLDLFAGMHDDAFDTLVYGSFLQRFPQGVTLVRESDPADFLHVVVDGLVEMYAGTGARETTLDIVAPVGVFILAAVLNDEICLQSARTLEPSNILMIPAARIRQAMQTDPAFARATVIELAASYRRTIKDLKDQKLRTGAERLANWLLRTETEQGGQGSVEIRVEKRILASRLGMTPENLSRAFSALKAYGVKVSGSRVSILDPASLTGFAKPNTLIDTPEKNAALRGN
ncbi:helix-turn-helix domain-containing protein [Rhizobium sp. BR 314]|uniref:helix-turn-helix domain-containing protein n=1 Tax=Rhizobium sp. BR 314 TaxID=3040013 RepID=UPI0039BFE801